MSKASFTRTSKASTKHLTTEDMGKRTKTTKNLGMPEKILTTSNLEDEQTRSDVCKVADLKVVSDEAEGVVYVDRFGRHRDISMEGDKQPCSTSFEGEIVLPTTSSASEVCWDFKHGLCEWGTQCRHIHYLNMQSGVNKRIPKDILQDHAKNVNVSSMTRSRPD
ncbi:hypothetical protein EV361DRAFT_927396 [Lentinula raphanica]|nr:hypothetical protein EV361DRAFT_927396 [Lentinula raphanica]